MSLFLHAQFVRLDDAVRIRHLEEVREAYERRRYAELEAAGVSLKEAIFTVDDEIRAGAALQAKPVRVVRTAGGDDEV
ncbi:hypothetical protein [Pseudorhodoferax sp. Leaf274]|uniref:hypothetical protein n=1 Tax=Pseudorhodoferax sp. Leaf274 TaxID=1736318 RepID=UPI000702E6E8|nr:hypothetical protein [Pseudorhodoferax sp. Leaf274]KQP43940.1 hypothetical protein ASF44_28855 [Pseudorhodoferax sp. Leaf274]